MSREHARIRRDPQTGAFFLIDLSSLGTTLNGRHVPRGLRRSRRARSGRTAWKHRFPIRRASASPTRCISSSSGAMTLLLIARYVLLTGLVAVVASQVWLMVTAEASAKPCARSTRLRRLARPHPGLQREVNEDRFHVDQHARPVHRDRRRRRTGRRRQGGRRRAVRCFANASSARRARWPSACAKRSPSPTTRSIVSPRPVRNGTAWPACSRSPGRRGRQATIGHVGDTRLYKLRDGRIEKITRDHSPVGEREDAGEISELEAMRHPRRNEVYRDVGSEPHAPDDPGFVDVARDSVRARTRRCCCAATA